MRHVGHGISKYSSLYLHTHTVMDVTQRLEFESFVVLFCIYVESELKQSTQKTK